MAEYTEMTTTEVAGVMANAVGSAMGLPVETEDTPPTPEGGRAPEREPVEVEAPEPTLADPEPEPTETEDLAENTEDTDTEEAPVEVELSTAAEFTNALREAGLSDLTEADLYSLQVPVPRPDGTSELMSFGEMKDRITHGKVAERDTSALAAEREAFQTEKTAREAQAQAYETELAAGMQFVQNTLVAEKQSIDALRDMDPAEYAAQSQQWTEKAREFDSIKARLIAARQDAQTKSQEEAEQARNQNLLREQRALLVALPELADPQKAKDFESNITPYLTSLGFTQDEVVGLSDHRYLVVAEKARQWDLHQETVENTVVAKRKVLTINGKKLKPGASNRSERGTSVRRANQRRLSQSGTIKDAQPVIGDILSRFQ